MSMKMKGLLKGLRYISTIFDEEEETEMQIGFPTDVKHVAHIGWDGPTANSPSWINQFKDGESGGGGGGGAPPTSKEVDQQNARRTRDTRFQAEEKRISTGSDPPIDSPSRRKSDRPKGSRRASSASTSATDSPRRSTGSDTKPKQLPTAEGEMTPSAGQKTSRRKKTKGSSTGGTSSSSRTSNKSKSTGPPPNGSPYSDPGTGQRRMKGKDTYQGSILKNSPEPQEDQKGLDDVSRGIQAM